MLKPLTRKMTTYRQTTPRAILSSGLGSYASSDPNAQAHFGPEAAAKAKELLAQSTEKARNAGFEIIAVDANPRDPEDTLKRFTETLRSRDFVGVNIGFGLRGHKEHTALFEKMLNAACEIRPGIKIMFSNGPGEVFTAIRRNFPEDSTS